MDNNESFLNNYHEKLEQGLLQLCKEKGIYAGRLNSTEDIDNLWLTLAKDYLSDAVPEIINYPVVSLAWAMFLGMAVAHGWDDDWEATKKKTYTEYYGTQGFDDMDEHILQDILDMPLESHEAQQTNAIVRQLAEYTVSAIQHERIEAQSSLAFHIFARSCTAMFQIGAHIELARLGYKMDKMN